MSEVPGPFPCAICGAFPRLLPSGRWEMEHDPAQHMSAQSRRIVTDLNRPAQVCEDDDD
jgi:hypothetical protein